jgi:hypothetical protein
VELLARKPFWERRIAVLEPLDLDSLRVVSGCILASAEAPDEALQEARGGQTVGPMDPSVSTFTDRIQPVKGGSAMPVDIHPATEEVFAGRNRYLVAPVDPALLAGGREVWKRLVERFGQRRDIEVDRAGGIDLVLNCAGDDIAGRKFGVVVVVGHEPITIGVPEHATLAADRLAEEERVVDCSGGRMELDVLHVLDVGSGEKRHADAVAR